MGLVDKYLECVHSQYIQTNLFCHTDRNVHIIYFKRCHNKLRNMLRTQIVLLLSLASWTASFSTGRPYATRESLTARRLRAGQEHVAAAGLTALRMAPKFDGEKWLAQSEDELPSAGYGIGKTFLLQGPKPVFTRLFQQDDYEQAVLKFMATDGCDRITAQGNMDAYLRNPQDWMFNRMEEEKRGVKYNYTNLQPKEIVLVLVWSTIVGAVVGRALYSLAMGVDFVSFPSLISVEAIFGMWSGCWQLSCFY